MKIYALARGRRYHRFPDCVGLNSHATWNGWDAPVPGITRRDAAARGLTPCGVCKPAPLLTVVREAAS